MSDETFTGTPLCPICGYGQLSIVKPELWHCDYKPCNSEFFIDGEPGCRTINVRDIPKPERTGFMLWLLGPRS